MPNSVKFLVALSALAFAVGLYFPLGVLLETGPSALAYGVIMVSIPAWIAGALSGGTAGYLLTRAGDRAPRLRRLSWSMSVLNLLAVVVCLIWAPAGIS